MTRDVTSRIVPSLQCPSCEEILAVAVYSGFLGHISFAVAVPATLVDGAHRIAFSRPCIASAHQDDLFVHVAQVWEDVRQADPIKTDSVGPLGTTDKCAA